MTAFGGAYWKRRGARLLAGWASIAVVALVASTASAQALTSMAVTPASVDLAGFVVTGFRQVEVGITNTGAAPLVVSGLFLPPPIVQLGTDLCTGRPLAPGATCTIDLFFRAVSAGSSSGAIVLQANVPGGSVAIPVTWQVAPYPLVTSVDILRFGYQPVDAAPHVALLTITNTSTTRYDLGFRLQPGFVCTGFAEPLPSSPCEQARRDGVASFRVEGACAALEGGQSCTMPVAFDPAAQGDLSAVLVVLVGNGGQYVGLTGVGLPQQRTPGTVIAIEYYRQADAAHFHYFVTASPAEIDALDNGFTKGWARTGDMFWVFPGDAPAPPGSTPVCRFYGRPEAGLDSHFYSAAPDECDDVARRFPSAWLLESATYFHAFLPDRTSGACPLRTLPVYRAFNNRRDANHYYSLSRQGAADPNAIGWTPEGYGPDAVAFCVPE